MNHENIQPSKAHLSSIVVIDDEEDILKSLKSLFHRDKYKMYFLLQEYMPWNFLNITVWML